MIATLIKNEMKKMLLKKSVIALWIFALLFSKILIHMDVPSGLYADAFYKIYGFLPVTILVVLFALAGSYSEELETGMQNLIATTKNKRKIVKAKAIAGGMSSILINLSVISMILLDAYKKAEMLGLSLPIKELWYFSSATRSMSVIQMIGLLFVTASMGFFFYAQLILFLSSKGKSSILPFILSGALVGIPYLLENFLPNKVQMLNPLWGTFSYQLIKHNASTLAFALHLSLLVIGSIILVACTKKGVK